MVRPEGDVQQGCDGLHAGGGGVAQRLRVGPGLHAPGPPSSSALPPLLLPLGAALILLAVTQNVNVASGCEHFRIRDRQQGERIPQAIKVSHS